MKYFVLAGEASGDLHASNLIRALQKQDAEATFVGMGGDLMQAAGCRLVQHYREMAFMGFVAVLKNLCKVRRNFEIAHQALLETQPDVLVLIDYPSFNLKIAKWCKKHLPNTKICYYIPPKVWAWKRWRVHKIAQLSDLILGIFPFEPPFYAKYGYKCYYVGNPTVESVDSDSKVTEFDSSKVEKKKYIAILPGSRKHEIANCLPTMLEAARRFPDYKIVVTGAPGIEPEFYNAPHPPKRGVSTPEFQLVFNQTYEVVRGASAAIVNSGTATLETALLGCPQVAVYYVEFGRLMGLLRPIMFQIPHFTLVDIIPNREVIKELIAYLFTADNIEAELKQILEDETYREKMLQGYEEIRTLLTNQRAADTAAKLIINDR